jgi:hypothetical protein
MKTKVLIMIALFILTGTKIFAQNGTVLTDIKGLDVKESDPDVQGTPYLFDDWMPGSAITETGNTYANLKLKYDIRFNQVIFLRNEDQPMLFAEPLNSFVINNMHFAKGFTPVDVQTSSTFYQVLADGKVKLLKYFRKVVEERQSYGAPTEKKYRQSQYYYIARGNQMITVRPDKKTMLAALPGHADQLEAYIKDHHINLKDDAGAAQLVTYYNTL